MVAVRVALTLEAARGHSEDRENAGGKVRLPPHVTAHHGPEYLSASASELRKSANRKGQQAERRWLSTFLDCALRPAAPDALPEIQARLQWIGADDEPELVKWRRRSTAGSCRGQAGRPPPRARVPSGQAHIEGQNDTVSGKRSVGALVRTTVLHDVESPSTARRSGAVSASFCRRVDTVAVRPAHG
jgi:hypothetical protein